MKKAGPPAKPKIKPSVKMKGFFWSWIKFKSDEDYKDSDGVSVMTPRS